MANADPLQVALGRSNREQVVTSRPSVATTLQALEMTNGRELDELMKKGAEHWIKTGPASSPELVAAIYKTAFGRAPSAGEKDLAAGMMGDPVRPEGLEDFLWAVCMHPEFQLIY
jgi:hypothetical protein